MCMDVLSAHMCTRSSVHGDQKRVIHFLKLELAMVMSHHVGPLQEQQVLHLSRWYILLVLYY